MAKETGYIAQTIGFVSMDCVVILGEGGFEKIRPETVDFRKSFSNKAVEFRVCSLLGTTFNDHRGEFWLQARRQRDLHEFVATFFKVDTGHDSQVDCSPEIDEICIALILDLHLSFFLLFLVRTLIGFVLVFFIIGTLAKNFGLELLVGLFVLLPLRIEFEDIETILSINFIIETDTMGNLIFLLNQVEFLLDRRVVLVSILANLEQDLDHILNSFVDVGLVQNIPELIKHRQSDGSAHLFQVLADFPGQTDGNLHAIVRRFM
jgi:hypothetical protein